MAAPAEIQPLPVWRVVRLVSWLKELQLQLQRAAGCRTLGCGDGGTATLCPACAYQLASRMADLSAAAGVGPERLLLLLALQGLSRAEELMAEGLAEAEELRQAGPG